MHHAWSRPQTSVARQGPGAAPRGMCSSGAVIMFQDEVHGEMQQQRVITAAKSMLTLEKGSVGPLKGVAHPLGPCASMENACQ